MVTSRREFLVGSLGVVALGAAGCTSSSPTRGSTSSPGKIAGSITVWDFLNQAVGPSEDALFRAEYPGVTLTRVHQPGTNYTQLVQAALGSHSAPDALVLGAGGPITQFSAGLERLDDRLTSDMKQNLAFGGLMSPSFDASKGIYGLPLDLTGALFFYDKELFSRAGLDPEKPPTSWPQLQTAAAKLMAAGITPFAAGDKEGLEASAWFSVLAPMILRPPQTLDLAQGKLKFDSDPVRQVFDKYVQIAKAGWFQKSWRTDGVATEAVDYFSAGKAGMTLIIPPYVSVFRKQLGDKLGSFQALGLTDGAKPNYLPYGPGLALTVSKQSQNKDAAFAWVSWRTSQAMQQRDLNALGSAVRDEAKDARLPTDKRVKPTASTTIVLRDMVNAIQAATIFPGAQSLWKPPVFAASLTNFGPVVDGHASLGDALKAMDSAQAAAK